MSLKEVFASIEKLNDEYIKFWIDVCNIESPTESKADVDRCGNYFIEKAHAFDWKIDIHEEDISGNCICITMNPDSAERPVVFSAHIDTVHPKGIFGYPPTRCDEENIYGPGVTDCKGGAVAAFLAMSALSSCGFRARPIKLIIQSDEENGSRNSNKRTVQYMCECAKDAVAFLNGEGHRDGLTVTRRKGILKYRFEITGKAVHSSVCYTGSSAISEAAHKIIELEKLKDENGLTCNCGKISGGTAENTVPEKCTFTADIRFATPEQEAQAKTLIRMLEETSSVPETSCSATLLSYRVALPRNERNLNLLTRANEIFRQANLPELAEDSGNGGSDASDVSAFGIPVLDSFGVTGSRIHSIDEYARLSSLAEAAKRMAAIAYLI